MPRRSFKDYFKPRPASGVSSICPCPRCFAERASMASNSSTSSRKPKDPPPYSPPTPASVFTPAPAATLRTICTCAACFQTRDRNQSTDDCEVCRLMCSQSWEALPVYVDDRKASQDATRG